ncbi:ribosomal RNA large subunit methyltransferase F [Rhodotorula toruloides]|uniref:Ribosomal RNA large subunit methyltransferase F n=1 Tax=Rhodotorula toruloides TaxID=5286 RepID=A0A511KM44_RHOTO|nr:ribosomal RNA large subunit methyltransferase F [Rhodotorula toruloides]
MLATDIDDHSLEFAKRNISANCLSEAIQLFRVDSKGAIFPEEVVNSVEQIDFTMSNPPFYDSHEEIASSLAKKELEPFARCTGADNEMVTPGGEVAFVSRMVEESLVLGQQKIRWYTSLLGKYSSISPLILNYHVHALPPHGYTTRWVLSWSLQDKRFPLDSTYDPDMAAHSTATTTSSPSLPLARFLSPATLPATYFTPSLAPSHLSDPIEDVQETLDVVLRELVGEFVKAGAQDSLRERKRRRVKRSSGEGAASSGLEWRWSTAAGEGEQGGEVEERQVWIQAWRNVWSRKARRAMTATSSAANTTAAAEYDAVPARPLLELRITLDLSSPSSIPSPTVSNLPPCPSDTSPQVKLTLTWLRGLDASYPALTGFWSYLTRKVGDRVKLIGSEAERDREEGGARKERRREKAGSGRGRGGGEGQ